jgi:DNA sulfur modification protein DndD
MPSKAIMEEMLEEQICKVCNREAKEGTEAYTFMYNRLKNYLESQKPSEDENDEEDILFKNNYAKKLVSLDTTIDNNLIHIRNIHQNITDLLEFNQNRKSEIDDLKIKRDKEIADLESILGSLEIGQESLLNAWKNARGWKNDLSNKDLQIGNTASKIKNLKQELSIKQNEKEKIDTNSAHNYLLKTREVIRDIANIFDETKETKYEEFVTLLEKKSNEYLKKINIGSFTGYIKLERDKKHNEETVDVILMQEGEIFHYPNTSLQTSMHLAILFAISDLTKTDKEESYPLIFDAPTSSFDTVKRKHFFDVLSECNEQTILMTKDFTDESGKNKGLLYSDEFKSIKRNTAYVIRLEEPFDSQNLATINTILTKI